MRLSAPSSAEDETTPAWRASSVRRMCIGALLFLWMFLALALFPTSVQAAWPAIPSDDEIVQAAQRFMQANVTYLNLEDCAAIADATEREVCWTRRSMNTWFGPEITYRTEIVDASTLKIHHTAQTDPLVANAVILLYAQNNYNESVAGGERSTSVTYHTAVLEYSADATDAGWRFETNRWWQYDQADLDASLPPRESRDARVELLFLPLDDRGYYGWARGFLQSLSVAGYNGENDPSHMPLTFWIKLEDAGRAQPGVRTPFAVEGDVRCLADRYAVWDAGSGQWVESVHNFAAGPVAYTAAPQTNANGLVIVRLFLDYGRMRLFGLQLPCTLDFTAYAPNEESAETFQKAETSLEVVSPAFVRSVVYQVVTQEGAATRYQIYNVAQLRDWGAPLTPDEDQFGLNPTPYFEEPTQARVLSRISLDRQPFAPPAAADYFVPIKPGAQLDVDASMQPLLVGGDGSGRSWAPRAGDGIGVVVMWLDGSSGLFLVNNRPQLNSVLAMRVLGSWSTTQGMPMSDDGGLALFAIGQGVDWVVQRATVGGATALGGPVAGAMAAVIVGSVQTVNDIDELSNLARRNRRVIWLRSAVALTAAPDGRNTLYVFEGAPGVEDAAGGEAPVAPGQAVEFALEGEITPPAAQEPSPAAQALFDALPAADVPIAASSQGATMEEMARDGAVGSIARVADAAGEDAASGWDSADLEIDGIEDLPAAGWPAGLVIGVATLAVVASLGLAWRRRARRAPSTAGSSAALTLQPVESPKTRKKSSAPPRAALSKRSRVAAPAVPPVATHIVAADEPPLAPPAPTTRSKTPASSRAAICPRCGKTIRADARFCGECGAPREPVAEASPPDVNICPACQAPVRPGARFCGACGHSLSA